MEIPDVLVVTKADLGDVALRARRDLNAALRSLGRRDVPVVAVSAVPPAEGIDDLIEALDAHRGRLDIAQRRLAARRAGALADFVAEHGARGLRALGGRRAALRALEGQDPGADVPTLLATLEAEAGVR
jgi:LAO/AO transport system kinase